MEVSLVGVALSHCHWYALVHTALYINYLVLILSFSVLEGNAGRYSSLIVRMGALGGGGGLACKSDSAWLLPVLPLVIQHSPKSYIKKIYIYIPFLKEFRRMSTNNFH